MLDFLLGLQYFGTKGRTVEAVGLTVLYAGLFDFFLAFVKHLLHFLDLLDSLFILRNGKLFDVVVGDIVVDMEDELA